MMGDHGNEQAAKVALVAEGGGQRGIFTAGVLDAWLRAKYNPFDLLLGTSAGAQNLTSFLAGQAGYARRLIMTLSKQVEFVDPKRYLLGGHLVDFDWYFEQTKRQEYSLDLCAAYEQLRQKRLLIVATGLHDRKAYYFEPELHNWRELLKASCALPLLYRHGVAIGGQRYVDGGLAAPLPVQEAYHRGARRIVVIRTLSTSFQTEFAWANKLKDWLCAPGYCPKTLDYLVQHALAYESELAFMASPPADVEIKQIIPPASLCTKLLGSSRVALYRDYQLGVIAGLDFLTLWH
ncbi:patatin-like phospholipase family protein [Shewanella salipaludis]|uniref:Patatin family protein n=1 Tax=Shewanella salipaludis TaxID=2723052 RepID=A0A972FXX4_9GAMM|nr:patatin family protein [Shewanella salipaludis]NMH63569.1 patatin family protein [Shewanella salipaludis]